VYHCIKKKDFRNTTHTDMKSQANILKSFGCCLIRSNFLHGNTSCFVTMSSIVCHSVHYTKNVPPQC
jgi:hypothetical protein